MEYLPLSENKLIQAIGRKDWQAVRGICETEEHLINTYDDHAEYEYWYKTPLTYAVFNNAPDDILLNMIAKATLENLECKCHLDGSTILHHCAYLARVTPLRSALERTKNANVTDEYGSTPLHYCLFAPLNYDEHRETTMCLMMHGASISIKNRWRKTALDFYDDDECVKYEETSRSEKKQTLKKLLIELSVPSEILARGEAAVKAFEHEMQNGEITVVNARFMFMGKEGAGKTSCVNHILGKAFNENEKSTDGIVTTTVFQTFGEDCSEWQMTDVDVSELTKQIKEGAIAENIAKKLKQPESQQSTLPTFTSSLKVELKEATSVVTSNERENSEEPQGPSGLQTNRSMGRQDTFEKKLPDRLHKLVVNRLAEQEPSNVGPSEVTSIWDYAGQLKYYITHQIYLKGGASYGVVFSLLDDLHDFVKPRDLHKGKFSMTNLEMILFWMRSIFEQAVLPNVEKKTIFFNAEISSPPISLIATHKDQLSKSEAETRIKTMYEKIFDAIKGTAYETHVDRTIYAVDNTSKMDEGIEKLKKNVGGYMKAMARTVPTNWVDFQSKVQELGKTKLWVSLEEITAVAAECGIAKDTITTVLDYLNDTGIILYTKTNEKLKNTVITNLHMLIDFDFLTKIITVVKPDDISPTMMPMWHKLDNEGILEEELLRHLWRHEIEKDASNFDVFLELMMTFKLLFELRTVHRTKNQEPRRKKKKGDQQDTRRFIVPSRMQVNKESLEVKKDEKQTVSVYVTPTDFLPDAVYNILVVAFLDLMEAKDRSGEGVELFQNCSDFDLDDDHVVSLGAVKIENRHALKLEISSLIEEDENVAAELDPSFCIEVLHYLKNQLKTVYGTTEGIGYKLRVLCSVCQPTQKPHLHDLEDCLKKRVKCRKKAMDTSRLRKLFSVVTGSSESTDASSRAMEPVSPKKCYPGRLITELELNTFSGKLGADWRSFIRSLGMKDNEIFHACPVYSTERDKIFCCLLKWRDREASNATVKVLVEKCIEHQIDVDVYEFLSE